MPSQSIASSGILSFNHVSVTQTISISYISTSISKSFILLGRDLAFTNITLGKNLLLLILVTLFSKEKLIKLCALAREWEAILKANLKLVPLMYDCSHLLVIQTGIWLSWGIISSSLDISSFNTSRTCPGRVGEGPQKTARIEQCNILLAQQHVQRLLPSQG
jgi:hypothetical protein